MFYMGHVIDIFCERVFLVCFLNILHAIVKFTLLMLWWFCSRGGRFNHNEKCGYHGMGRQWVWIKTYTPWNASRAAIEVMEQGWMYIVSHETLYTVLPCFVVVLDHWFINLLPLDKMVIFLQTIYSDAFPLMKSSVFWLKFHLILFLKVQLTIN